jgi:hypothetical protein
MLIAILMIIGGSHLSAFLSIVSIDLDEDLVVPKNRRPLSAGPQGLRENLAKSGRPRHQQSMRIARNAPGQPDSMKCLARRREADGGEKRLPASATRSPKGI